MIMIGQVSGGSLSSSSGLAGDVAVSDGSLGSGASASSITFSGSATNGSDESVDDASGVVKLSSGPSETASSGDASVESGVAATEVGCVSVSGESITSSTGGAVVGASGMDCSDLSDLVSVGSGAASAAWGRERRFFVVEQRFWRQPEPRAGRQQCCWRRCGVGWRWCGYKNAAQKVKIAGSANSHGAGGYVSIYRGSSANVGGTVLLTSGSNDVSCAGARVPTSIISSGSRGNIEVRTSPSSVSRGSVRIGISSGDTSAGKSMCGVYGGRFKVASKKNVSPLIYKLPMTKVDERFDMVSNGAVHYRVVFDN
ncbi:hypothetical protein PC128_g12558 [Phytophthora cactorum]|nr:hypothetical protein PC128_g12558 [Phytophthora cactorum]